MELRNRIFIWVFVFLMLAAVAAVFSRPPMPQAVDYHNFADQRGTLGIPNFGDVASNVPFLVVGVWALVALLRRNSKLSFVEPAEKWAYVVTYVGLTLTFFGSSYYHWHPGNQRLVWDRLPYTLLFMGLFSATVAERISLKAGLLSLLPLSLLGPGSVLYWKWTEAQGRGDLRPYMVVQFGSVLAVILALLLFRSRYSHTGWLIAAVMAYISAKFLEAFDRQVYALGHVVSGHTLKHLTAALSMYLIFAMLRRRHPLETSGRRSSACDSEAELVAGRL
jgi:hypothetical protein